ncbi:MAG TPA: ISAzo13 family transposase [Candidatus Eisenbacteria bacterium]
MDPLPESVIQTMRSAAALLCGDKRRRFQALVARDHCGGSARIAERLFCWGRESVETGLGELRTGITCLVNSVYRGRRGIEVRHPGILTELELLLANDTAGNPMCEEKWVRGSLDHLSRQLKEKGYKVGCKAVRRILRGMGYSRKSNRRRQPRPHCPTRNSQFEYIALQRRKFTTAALPVISIDTKKKELIGAFRNKGQTWCKDAEEVDEHDFPGASQRKAVPFGIYDPARNTGHVVVGASNNTPEFATSSIDQWWVTKGCLAYPGAKELLILADGGGGNGSRARAWKLNLQTRICDKHRLTVTVCHYPPGCSKWNPVEHRLFSYISTNWAGKPLRSLDIMLAYIRGTTTRTGLAVTAVLDEATYKKGQKVTKKELDALNLRWHDVLPDWNYTLTPRDPVARELAGDSSVRTGRGGVPVTRPPTRRGGRSGG